jgi:dTMP kinase
MMRGRFITFEGIDGAGKSTLIAALAEHLRSQGKAVRSTREPGGTPAAERIRDLVLNVPLHAETEAMLMFAARHEHLTDVIRPALQAGEWVLCDRFSDATFAYQVGGRGITESRFATLEAWVHGDLQPDLTLLVDVSPAVAAARRAAQRASSDTFERRDAAFFDRVRAAYLRRAEGARFARLDGDRPLPEVLSQVLRCVAERLP